MKVFRCKVTEMFCSFNSDRKRVFSRKRSQPVICTLTPAVESAAPDPEERGDTLFSDEISSQNGGGLMWKPTLESALYV